MGTVSESTTRFTPVPSWEQLPDSYLHRDGSDVAVDSYDRVYLLTRFDSRVLVYESDGRFVMSWGEDTLSKDPHGITVGPDNFVYVADRGAHVIRKFTPSGHPKALFGKEGEPSDTGYDPHIKDPFEREARMRPGPPFNRPTKVAVAIGGDFFVADGYANARIHHFAANGDLINSWGEPGPRPGQFRVPHSVQLQNDHLYVSDRENGRIQIFSTDGKLLDVWQFQRPEGIVFDQAGFGYISDAPDGPPHPSMAYTGRTRLIGRLTVVDPAGTVIETFEGGDPNDNRPGNFLSISGIAIDSRGNLYITQNVDAGRRSMGLSYEPRFPVIQKLQRV